MKIEDIKEGKRKATIFVDGKAYDFSLEVLYKQRLTIGEIDPKAFFDIKNESDKHLAKGYLFSILARSIRSKKEAIDKLRQKGYYPKAIEYAIEKAEEYELIDDKNYTKCYINTYSQTKGIKLLRCELIRKGISEEIINSFMDDVGDLQEEACKKIAEKQFRIKGDKLTKEKLYNHLYRKGFENETIKKTIDIVLRDTE